MDETYLGHFACLPYGVDANAHLLYIVEAVEHAEYIDAVLGRQSHELRNHVVRVRGVAHSVRPSDEHLFEIHRAFSQRSHATDGKEKLSHRDIRFWACYSGKGLT